MNDFIDAKIRRAARLRGMTGKRLENYISKTNDKIGALQPKQSEPKPTKKEKK